MEVTIDMVRKAVRALGDGGREVSYRQVYEALGLENEAEQAVVRSRISSMKRHGEVRAARPGVVTYDEQHRPREGRMHSVIWRFVRTAKAGWSISECALMTRVSYTHILRYVTWLEGAGFVERAGRDSRRATLFRATGKAQATPETPYPPVRAADPFQKERTAAATITRLMLCADPYAPRTARTITEAANVLLARFSKITHELVTENENEEVSHVD